MEESAAAHVPSAWKRCLQWTLAALTYFASIASVLQFFGGIQSVPALWHAPTEFRIQAGDPQASQPAPIEGLLTVLAFERRTDSRGTITPDLYYSTPTVHIGDADSLTAPISDFPVLPGQINIRIDKEGFITERATLQAEAGQRFVLSQVLFPATPSGAVVRHLYVQARVDGIRAGRILGIAVAIVVPLYFVAFAWISAKCHRAVLSPLIAGALLGVLGMYFRSFCIDQGFDSANVPSAIFLVAIVTGWPHFAMWELFESMRRESRKRTKLAGGSDHPWL